MGELTRVFNGSTKWIVGLVGILAMLTAGSLALQVRQALQHVEAEEERRTMTATLAKMDAALSDVQRRMTKLEERAAIADALAEAKRGRGNQ